MASSVAPSRPLTDAECTRGIATRPGEYALTVRVGGSDWQLWRSQLAAPAEGARQALIAARDIAASASVRKVLAQAVYPEIFVVFADQSNCRGRWPR